ncbi:hypothetical protein C8F01DRAFT_1081431 [Mycena amicta]|nr:hypothetical protein C8F01DRAFT_1081431 [Mycena amicta]
MPFTIACPSLATSFSNDLLDGRMQLFEVADSHQTRSYTIDEFGIRDGYAQSQTVLPRRRVEVAGAGGPCVRVEERHGGRECIHVHVRRRSTVSAKMPVGVSARSSGWREVEVAKAARHEPTLAVEGGAGGGRRVNSENGTQAEADAQL